MQRIFRAYGVETGEVFAIPTCIFVTITTPEGKSITKIKRLYTRGTDFWDKVDQANDLCRRICRTRPDISSIHAEVEKINRRPVYDFWQRRLPRLPWSPFPLPCSMEEPCRTRFVPCFAAPGSSWSTTSWGGSRQTPSLPISSPSCVAATIPAMLAVQMGFGANLDKIIIGCPDEPGPRHRHHQLYARHHGRRFDRGA